MTDKIAIIDIDGCLCDYPNVVFFEYVYSKVGKRYKDLACLKKDIGTERYEEIKSDYRMSGLKQTLEIKDGAIAGMIGLKKQGFEIIILTSRPNIFNVAIDTHSWLNKKGFHYDKLFFVDDKQTFLLSSIDHQVVVVDDNYSGLVNYANDPNVMLFHFGILPIDGEVPENYQRVSTWSEILVSTARGIAVNA